MNVMSIITQLKSERDRIDNAIAAIEGIGNRNVRSTRALSGTPRKRRRMSAAVRRKMSEAKKKWWVQRRKRAAGA